MVNADFRPPGIIFDLEKLHWRCRKPVYERQKRVHGPRKPVYEPRKSVYGLRKPKKRPLPPMGEAKGQGARTNALQLGTWLYIDVYVHTYVCMCTYANEVELNARCGGSNWLLKRL